MAHQQTFPAAEGSSAASQQIVRQLRARLDSLATTAAEDFSVATFSTGSRAIDGLLPRGGLRVDSVTEWVAENEACGTAALSLITAANRLKCCPGPLVVVAQPSEFYPPAAAALGIDPQRMVWVRPECPADTVWAIDQALRCDAVAAVWAIVGSAVDDRDARRFQLAAEAGRTPGIFLRPRPARGRPSFAEVRFHVRLAPSQDTDASQNTAAFPSLRVTLDRCRGASAHKAVWVQIDDQARLQTMTPPDSVPRLSPRTSAHETTAAVHLAGELAHPKTAVPRSRRRA